MFSVQELIQVTKAKAMRKPYAARCAGISIDTRTIGLHEAFLAVQGLQFDGHDFIAQAIKKGARVIICERKFASRIPRKGRATFLLVKSSVKALGDIARHHRLKYDIPLIAVTGSSGKTTTKEMTASILSRRYTVLKNEGTQNNHIGVPLTLLRLRPRHSLAVIEIGTNHFGEVGYLASLCKPQVAVLTAVGPCHLEFLKNEKGVFKEKFSLVESLGKPGVAVLNADDDLLRPKLYARSAFHFFVGFGIYNKSDFKASNIVPKENVISFVVNKRCAIKLASAGFHNIYNALASAAVARIFGLHYRDITDALSEFVFPKGRLIVSSSKGYKVIDDTYNSNPLSLHEALRTLDAIKVKGRKILVMGDMKELGVKSKRLHTQAGRHAAAVCDAIITVGEFSKIAADAAVACGIDTKSIITCATAEEAGSVLINTFSPTKDDIVLIKGSRAMQMEHIV